MYQLRSEAFSLPIHCRLREPGAQFLKRPLRTDHHKQRMSVEYLLERDQSRHCQCLQVGFEPNKVLESD